MNESQIFAIYRKATLSSGVERWKRMRVFSSEKNPILFPLHPLKLSDSSAEDADYRFFVWHT